MEYKILALGSFVLKNHNGYLVNTNTLGQIDRPYSKPIERVIEVYKTVFKNEVHSIYIRGSVARGKAIVGFSDYDCFAILNSAPDSLQYSQIKNEINLLNKEFDFVSNFDLYFFTTHDLFENPDFEHWKFALKIQSVCIYGVSVIPLLPDFCPDRSIIFSLFHLESRITKAKEKLYSCFDLAQTKYWCSWIMRTFVRCGLELVIEREGQYTNELYLCYQTFSKYYPERESQMKSALESAINPISKLEIILGSIESLGGWLIDERVRIYGQ